VRAELVGPRVAAPTPGGTAHEQGERRVFLTRLLGGTGTPAVDPAEARRRQQAGALLVDVREPDEWRGGHAPGARHLPLGRLAGEIGTLPAERELLFLCRSGNRSGRATALALEAGLAARNVRGGMIAWARAGLPVER
jgi:rhodanese-related sulfurtransferase